jgi:hypothetical protein
MATVITTTITTNTNELGERRLLLPLAGRGQGLGVVETILDDAEPPPTRSQFYEARGVAPTTTP